MKNTQFLRFDRCAVVVLVSRRMRAISERRCVMDDLDRHLEREKRKKAKLHNRAASALTEVFKDCGLSDSTAFGAACRVVYDARELVDKALRSLPPHRY